MSVEPSLESGMSTDDTHRTPKWLTDLFDHPDIGGIGLDPCAAPQRLYAATNVVELQPPLSAADLARIRKKKGEAGVARALVAWAADDTARRTVRASHPTVVPASGLEVSWRELAKGKLTFANHPFSNGEAWHCKASEEDTEVMLLTPARMNAAYMHEHTFPTCSAIFLPKRRVTFEGSNTQPPFHVFFPYWGDRVAVFARVLAPYMTLFVPG